MATISPEPVRFDPDTTLFEARINLGDRPCPLSIVDLDEQDTELATKLAQKTGDWLENRLPAAKEFAATSLLTASTTHQQFTDTISLENVTIFSDGSFTIHFNDGGLFQGRPIDVEISQDGAPTRATLSE